MPKVSIIIPVYNVEKYLKECLDSVVNQTLSDIEIICINDCSPDNSLSIIKEYTNNDSRIKLIDLEQNQGQGAAKNIGIDNAQGEYIMFLDPDDWLETDACELAYKQISDNNNDFAYFNLKFFDELSGEYKIDHLRLKPFLLKLGKDSFSFDELDIPYIGFGEAVYKIYNRDFLNKNNIRFSQNRFGEDIPFYIKSVISTNNVSVIDKPLYVYRLREQSAITNPLNYKELLSSRKKAYEIAISSKDEKKIKMYLVAHISQIMARYKTWDNLDKTSRKDFYNMIKKEFLFIEKENNLNKIKNYINYFKFKLHIILPYQLFCLIENLEYISQNIFAIKNEYKNNVKSKVITILGIKLRVRKRI